MRNVYILVLLPALLAAAPAGAIVGTIDNVPAATLMLPYFEVDLNNAEGVNTLFSINNSAASAVLTKVVVWSDQGIPVLNFNVYLTGYDVQTINMRDILVLGNVPRTASSGQDPADTISPQGPLSQDVNFASCTNLPFANPAVSESFRQHLQAWLTGLESPATQDCAGSKTIVGKTGIARGYVTVDTVSACDLFFPGDWAAYGPALTDQNVLWGDWFIVNPGENFAQGDMLVHIESCPTCFAAGDHTFYGRYNFAQADDGREPLPTTWASRYLNGGPFDGGTSLLIWRETNRTTEPYRCTRSGPLSWYPLDTEQALVFDEFENPVEEATCTEDPDCPFRVEIANAAQRIDVKNGLETPFDFGWVYLNLQHADLAYADNAAQSWVIVVMDASGRFSIGYDVLQLDNANDPAGSIGTF
ncbi:MAG: hypothetical protein QOH06_1892 [Acidobacteriota bacterium]|jgi:hypothetical protein|nr:hypothetical protein [Acidobacteriota bacterium]